jgi:putative ABC transport system permease protein
MWSRRHRDPRVADELRFHRDRLIEDYLGQGVSRQEAERRAFLEFGNVPQIEEAVRDVRGRWLDDLATDLRYAMRTLRRTPGFTAIAVLSFALGIGANAAIFTLINAVMLRTLPVREPHRLVQITRLLDGRPGVVSFPLFEQFRDNVKSISGAFAQVIASQAVVIDGEEELVSTDLVSGGYYGVLGLEPAAGRLLTPADDVVSPASPAAVISDRYWQRRFARSPSAIGKSVTIGERLFTIVGVTPSWYDSATAGHVPDLTLPLLMKTATGPQYRSKDFNWLNMLARLKPGATVEEANAEVQVLFASFVQAQSSQAPEKERANLLRQHAIALAAPDGFNPFRDNVGRPLLVLMGIVALILMLACVNLSSMLLARAAARQREISIRLAIGAGRGRVVRQFITESLVLASLGGAVGFAPAGWLSVRLYTLFVNGRDVVLSLAPDWRVLAFTALASCVACIVSGLAPALQAVRVNLNPALKEVRAHGHGRLGRALVVAQLTMSMILVVGATLFVGTFLRLYTVDRGFDSSGVLLTSVRHSRPYPPARVGTVRTAVLERLRALPGVQSASAAQVLPAAGILWDRDVQVDGYVFRPDEPEKVGFNVVAPDYFKTLGTPLVVGREFTDGDTDTGPKVAVVNESFARYFFGDQSAIAHRVTSVDVTYEIVGVVRDAKYQHLRDGIIRTMYIPWTQRQGDQPSSYNYMVRVAAGDPMRLAPGLDHLIREIDPALHVRTTAAYNTMIDRSISIERIMATLGGVFGLLALVVAGLGVFGVLAFQVARRTNELGVRIALGASRRAMTRLVLRDVARMLALGVALGSGGAFILAGVTRRMLFGLSPTDPGVFVVSASVLASAALVAAWLPARRAARIDPVVALRHE